MSWLNKFKKEYWGSWEEASDAVGYFQCAQSRLEKITGLGKIIQEKEGYDPSPNKIINLLGDEGEARTKLEMLKVYFKNLKKRKDGEENQIRVTSNIKEIFVEARKLESKYSAYIGSIPDYFLPKKE